MSKRVLAEVSKKVKRYIYLGGECMKVLLVDDDPAFRMLVTEILTAADYEVVSEKNGKLAWERLQVESADLAVLDVKMPEMDGYALLHKMRSNERFQTMPVLMLTIRGLPDDQVQGYEIGADDYLVKPFDHDIFIARLKALTRRTLRK